MFCYNPDVERSYILAPISGAIDMRNDLSSNYWAISLTLENNPGEPEPSV